MESGGKAVTKRYHRKLTSALSLVLPVILVFAILNCFITYMFYEDYKYKMNLMTEIAAKEEFSGLDAVSELLKDKDIETNEQGRRLLEQYGYWGNKGNAFYSQFRHQVMVTGAVSTVICVLLLTFLLYWKKKLPLMDTVISAVNRTYPKADEKEIEFVFDYEKELETCTIMQDKRWLGEAVINVLDNAVKYSPCGSKIFIRLQKRNDLVRMEIEDQGIGIPQNEYHKIFQRFYRGSSRKVMEKSGTGIGLFLSREIIEKHAGTITVTSGKKKKGSTFVIQLPYVG